MEIRKGAVLKDRYRLDRLLGRGGMASVWRGDDRVLDRAVAIKVLSDAIASDPSFQARFRREATVAAALSHPNLVRVFDYAEAGERPYLVMELVPAEDLGALIAHGESIDRGRLAEQLLAALAHIHAAGIIHRDVKPGNVLIEADGNAKLIDFGIALPPDATALTSTGLILGTKSFAAPEVMRGEPAGVRSDLYSCGLVLAACEGVRTPGLEALITELSAEETAARPPSARAALRDLEAAEEWAVDPLEETAAYAVEPERTSGPAIPTEPFEPVGEPPRVQSPAARARRRWAVALGLLAVIAAVAVAVATSLGGGDSGDDSPRVARERAAGAGAGANSPEAQTAPESETSAEPETAPEPEGSAEPKSASESEHAAEPKPASEPNSAAATPTASGDDAAGAGALNEQGYELIRAGRYEEAVPLLEESVRAFPAGTDDIDYAYALYNLGDALLRSGRAAEAIPVLEQRLQIPNQTGVVAAALEDARAAAAEPDQ